MSKWKQPYTTPVEEKTPPFKPACSSCKFYEAKQCRRYPRQQNDYYPIQPHDWCGEYQA